MKKLGIFILVVVIIGAIMFVTNPTKENFNNFLERKASRNINKYVGGSTGVVDELIKDGKAITAKYADSHYDRQDYYVLSIYTGKSSEAEAKYLGVFKIFMQME